MKRILKALSIVLFITIGISACDKKEEKSQVVDSRIVLGFSQLGDESEWRTASSDDIKRAANEAGIQLFFDNAQQKQFNQIKAIRSFILNRVDAIAFSPIVEDGWDNVLFEAKEAGIPVILVDRTIKTEEKDLYCAFLGSDFKKEGYEAGKWIIKRFADHDGVVKIAEIRGTDFASPAIGRRLGLLEALGQSDKFQIEVSVSGDFMKSKGRECMDDIIASHPDIDLLFAHNDDMALGAIESMEEFAIAPGKDILVVSVDAQKSGLEALKEGKINCIVECNPYFGEQLMQLVEKVVKGEEVPEITYAKETVFTEDDDFSLFPERP